VRQPALCIAKLSTAIETNSPPSNRRPLSFDLRMLAKKYLALPLWMMSKIVPNTTARTSTMSNPCRNPAGNDAAATLNGLTLSMKSSFSRALRDDAASVARAAVWTGFYKMPRLRRAFASICFVVRTFSWDAPLSPPQRTPECATRFAPAPIQVVYPPIRHC
jgi:hypothetical protein